MYFPRVIVEGGEGRVGVVEHAWRGGSREWVARRIRAAHARCMDAPRPAPVSSPAPRSPCLLPLSSTQLAMIFAYAIPRLRQDPSLRLLLINIDGQTVLQHVHSLLELDWPRDAEAIECMKRVALFPYSFRSSGRLHSILSDMPNSHALGSSKDPMLVVWNRPSSLYSSFREYLGQVALYYEALEASESRLLLLEDAEVVQKRELLPILRFYSATCNVD